MRKIISSSLLILIVIFGVNIKPACCEKSENENIPEESGFYYTIQEGDTLWDLSEKFYRSPWHWPGLWEMNEKIKNPHWIYPGKRIQIFYREELSLKPEAPDSMKQEKPKSAQVVPSYHYAKMDRIGFIKETAVPELGKIMHSPESKILLTEGDTVFVEPSGEGVLFPGKKYYVYETENILKKYDGKKFKGVKHSILGVLEVKNHRGDYVKAEIVDSFKDINSGHKVMSYTERGKDLTVEERPDEIEARLLSNDNDTILISDQTIAYIDLGKEDNIKPGQMYTIYKNPIRSESYYKEALVETEAMKTGTLIVLHTEKTASTVLVISCINETTDGYLVR